MNFLRRLLYKIVGLETYLFLISKFFFITFNLKILKGKKDFNCHYFVKKLVKKDDIIIDLGANLGYYSVIFSKLTGQKGKVYSIEPVSLFRKILKKNIGKRVNTEIIPYAIGTPDNEPIKMGVPYNSTHFSHGRTHVLTNNEDSTMKFDATLMTPDTIFKNIQELDYIKCDIEGYESVAMPLFKNLIEKYRPLIQIEVAPENIEAISDFFNELNYQRFSVSSKNLFFVDLKAKDISGDWILIPVEKKEVYSNLIH